MLYSSDRIHLIVKNNLSIIGGGSSSMSKDNHPPAKEVSSLP